MEKPPRIKKVEEWSAKHEKCPLSRCFASFDRLCPARYPEISRWAIQDKIKSFSIAYGGAPYWAIVHDKDDTRAHCHLCFTLPLKKTKGGAVRLLRYALGLEQDRISVNVEQGDGLIFAVRYLMHLDQDLASDEAEKYPYPKGEVWTNEPEYLEECISLKVRANGATTRQLIECVAKCATLTDVMVSIGLEAYRKYRFAILDLWNEKTRYIDQRVGLRDNKTA